MEQLLGLLLADALDQTLSNPTASHRWHTLLSLYSSGANDAERLAVQKHLLANVAPSGEAGFFRETFLAAVTDDALYSAKAGQLLKTLTPFDADRLMAFSVYEWGRQALGYGGLNQLVGALRAASVPDLMARIGQTLLPLSRVAQKTSGQLAKIALVVPYISNANHPPTVLALHHAKILSESGLQIGMFSSQEMRVQHMADYLGSNGQLLTPPPQLDTLRALIPSGVSLTICDERFSLMRRYQDLLISVGAFDPDLVMFVGLNSPLMTPLHAARPTLGLCIHAVQPMVPVDVWLTSKPSESNHLGAAWGDALPPAWGFHHPYRIQLKPTGKNRTRSQLALPADGVVLVTVGARLQTEISGPWASGMLEFLKQHPFITWLLVGGDGSVPPALREVAAGQIKTLTHQDDLRSVVRCADIYVNPQRLGGGFSLAEAMAEGLAVVALSDSDGGDKLGDAAVVSHNDFFATLQNLVIDSTARQQMGSAMRTRFAEKLDLNQSGPSLVSACQLAVARYRERQ